MSLRSALAGATTTAVAVAALGNPATVDAARDADRSSSSGTVVGFANWDVADAPGEVVGMVALRLGVLIVLAGLLCALVGRSRSRAAAFLGAWGAVGVAAGVAGAASYVYQVPIVLDGSSPAPDLRRRPGAGRERRRGLRAVDGVVRGLGRRPGDPARGRGGRRPRRSVRLDRRARVTGSAGRRAHRRAAAARGGRRPTPRTPGCDPAPRPSRPAAWAPRSSPGRASRSPRPPRRGGPRLRPGTT